MRRHLLSSVLSLSFFVAACGSDPTTTPAPTVTEPVQLAPELGTKGAATAVEVVAGSMKVPRDLAFNPLRPEELWIVSNDGSTLIVHDTVSNPRPERRVD